MLLEAVLLWLWPKYIVKNSHCNIEVLKVFPVLLMYNVVILNTSFVLYDLMLCSYLVSIYGPMHILCIQTLFRLIKVLVQLFDFITIIGLPEYWIIAYVF